jgi:hypothetical protein
MTIAPQTRTDPLHAFIAGAFIAGTPRPVPLTATRFDVIIDGGLAVVSTTRTFRNAEPDSIEATITFPVPVHATLFALRARIGERVLDARAKRREAARQDYESAIERGKTAVLHEEVLRGVHMLSVGHVAPGAEIEVRSSFAVTLANIDGRGALRIPLTVGDIYGRSRLPDSDDLQHGGARALADLRVECRDATVTLLGGRLDEGRAQVGLDAPIDLAVSAIVPRELRGRAADGREVELRIEPSASGEAALDTAILIDHSGSMGELCAIDCADTKHQAVLRGLDAIGQHIGPADLIDLWEFNDHVGHVGLTATGAEGLCTLARHLHGPSGGTEIGGALERVMAEASTHDILLVTDGKSHALDVHALARSGRRIGVILVGEDSLEANVGHLAALTGGDIFVAAGADLADVLRAAVRALRVPHQAAAPLAGMPQRVNVRRAGTAITASWQAASVPIEDTIETRAVAALAAGLVLPALPADEAARLAEAEGLVTHLTSLILVDEAGQVTEGIPATRKVALPTPRTAAAGVVAAAAPVRYLRSIDMAEESMERRLAMPRMAEAPARRNSMPEDESPSRPRRGLLERLTGLGKPAPVAPPSFGRADLSGLARRIDWASAPKQLQAGDLSGLASDVAQAIRAAAATREAIDLAKAFGLTPVALIIGLVAHAAASGNRSAARIARAIFGGRADAEIAAATQQLRVS